MDMSPYSLMPDIYSIGIDTDRSFQSPSLLYFVVEIDPDNVTLCNSN